MENTQTFAGTAAPIDEVALREARCAEHRARMRIQLALAALVAVLGAVMIMTGALVPFGIVLICLAVLGAGAIGLFMYMVSCVDNRSKLPLPEELDSVADYQRVKHGHTPSTPV